MSRIGKAPIKIPNNTDVSIQNRVVTVKGPKGELSYTHLEYVNVEVKDSIITISPVDDSKKSRSFWGLTRTLISNMCIGVTEGFKKELEIIGVGYKAEVKGKTLILSLGYSHKIEYIIPDDITIEHKKEKNDILTISGINKQLVGNVAAKIRSYRKPEPYKGKGIKYSDERIIRKEGKTAASAK